MDNTQQVYTGPSNSEFETASPEQKRVLIAKDVITALDSKRFNATGMIYVDFGEDFEVPNDNQELCNIIKDKNCNVCALGALFVSAVERYDELSCQEIQFEQGRTYPVISDNRGFIKYLGQFFDIEQLELIECAFEGRPTCGWILRNESHAIRRARIYCGDHCSSHWPAAKYRMRKIMNNIIRNNGTFDLNDNQD